MSRQPVIGSGVWLLWLSSNTLSCVCCVSSSGNSGDSTVTTVKFSLLVLRFVSVIHFPAAAQRDSSVVRLIKDDLILWCKGRELTLLRS